MRHSHILFSFILILQACGKNPHLSKAASKGSSVVTQLSPQTAQAAQTSPDLILRDKKSGREGLLDLGTSRTGERLTREWELVNVGDGTAHDITIPEKIGQFLITNIDCGNELKPKENCSLVGEIETFKSPTEKNVLEIDYKNEKHQPRKTQTAIVAQKEIVAPGPVAEVKKANVILVNKNDPSGVVILKDIPVGETREILLELRNVGNLDAQDVILPTVKEPFTIKNINCTKVLKINKSCDIVIVYQPKTPGESRVTLDIDYAPSAGTQEQVQTQVIATAVEVKKPATLALEGGVINQDIYNLLNINPENLSPYHLIRGIDLGTLIKGQDQKFTLVINNNGTGSAAQLTELIKFKSPYFELAGGSCVSGVKIEKKCDLNIIVHAKDLGKIHDVIELTYLDGAGNTRRLSVLTYALVKEVAVPKICKESKAARDVIAQMKKLGEMNTAGSYKLPYKRSGETAAKLGLLTNTESNQSIRIDFKGNSYVVPSVHNAMVQFGFNLSQNDIESLSDIKVELDILKLTQEDVKFDATEVLCINEIKKCSGAFFFDSNYRVLNTKNYELVNNQFSKELLKSVITDPSSLACEQTIGTNHAHKKQSAATTTHRLKTQISLKEMFKLSDEELIKIVKSKNGINFVLADDSLLLSTPRLVIEKKSESDCKN